MSKNILVVEDEGIVSLELTEQLERMGHSVVGVADTGEEALALTESTRPDLVLMDIRLKGPIDGAEAARRIRSVSDVPVVFLTAYSGDDVLQRAMQSEPYGYLVKPIQEQQLYGMLNVVWTKHRQDAMRDRNTRRFSAIVRALPHGIVLTDSDLNVRYLNRQARQILGVPGVRDVWGRNFLDITRVEEPEFGDLLRQELATVLETHGGAHLGTFRLTGGDGRTRPRRFEIAAFADSGEATPYGILIVVGDDPDRPGSTTNGVTNADAGTITPIWADSESLDPATSVDRLGELRSFLELEIIRVTLETAGELDYDQGFQDAQIQTSRRILELVFGEDALHEMDRITAT